MIGLNEFSMRVALGSVLTALFASAGLAEPAVEAANLQFQSFYAPTPGGHIVYTLLGSGFFRSMRSEEADRIVNAWVAAHPHGRVVSIGELPTGAANVQLIFAWLQDGKDNLNIDLVRRGAVPSSTMVDPAQRFDTSPKDSALRKASGRPRRLISDAAYQAFLDKIVAAEAEAKRAKAGIWADRYKETRELERVEQPKVE